jgi:hypothetical protein
MENKKWTDTDLRTAFEDGCKFLHFKDLQDFLLERRQNAKNEHSNCNILHVSNLLPDNSCRLTGSLCAGSYNKDAPSCQRCKGQL